MAQEKTAYQIFLIDDDAFLLDMYALKFTQREYQVTTASGTLEALDKLRSGYVPDVIVVDLVLPAMDGFQFLEQLTTEKLAPHALRVALSNLGQEEDMKHAAEVGATVYIIKAAATPSEVVERVTKELSKRNQ